MALERLTLKQPEILTRCISEFLVRSYFGGDKHDWMLQNVVNKILSFDVVSVSEITPCNKIDKLLVVVAYIKMKL